MDFDPITYAAVQQAIGLLKTGVASDGASRLMALLMSADVTGAKLETFLSTSEGPYALGDVLNSSLAMSRIFSLPNAVAAVVASSTAMNAIASLPGAMTAVVASSAVMIAMASSSTAMATIWASDSATDAVINSATARLAIYNSDTALAALQARPTQVQRLITSNAKVVLAATSTTSYVFVPNGTKCILLRRFYGNSPELDCIDWARGSTTSAVGQGPAGGGRNLDTGANALGCQNGSYTSNGIAPVLDDYTGNFVSAANGLQRRGASMGASLAVRYVLV